MYQYIIKNWSKLKYFMLFGLVLLFALTLTFFNKTDKIPQKKIQLTGQLIEATELKNFEKFILSHIKSPFVNLNYKIKQGDTIQKILYKYIVITNDIAKVITQYKKYGKPNQLLKGNEINIII